MTSRRFPAPWQVEQIPGGYKVLDANGQALAYVYTRETKQQADIAKVLTFDEARRIAVNVAKLLVLLRANAGQAAAVGAVPSVNKRPVAIRQRARLSMVLFVLKRKSDFGSIGFNLAVLDNHVLLHHFGYP